MLRYDKAAGGGLPLDDAGIAAAAAAYLERGALFMEPAECEVIRQPGRAAAVFYPKTDGLTNRSHPVTVTTDDYGAVTGLDYYKMSYERLASVGVISMKEAYYSLPPLADLGVLEGEGLRADINRCELVYGFWDSILQPAYLFEGEMVSPGTGEAAAFSYFVMASRFK
jgi:chromosome condensin MukBEF MukE localization factor